MNVETSIFTPATRRPRRSCPQRVNYVHNTPALRKPSKPCAGLTSGPKNYVYPSGEEAIDVDPERFRIPEAMEAIAVDLKHFRTHAHWKKLTSLAIDDLGHFRTHAHTGRQLHRGSAETKKLRRTRYRPSIFGTSGAILGVLRCVCG
jgi:hypothetical protein